MPFTIIFALLAGLLAPELSWAAGGTSVINPGGGLNVWDMYVFGNGRIIFDVLNGVKMLMVPSVGSTGFMTLLITLATMGFLVLALMAGFDPGKNLIKMFGYILVVWMVTFGTTRLTANVQVNDMVPNSSGTVETFIVSGVPALVVLPAALTSQVGRYFSQIVETYFSLPDSFKVAGSGAGVGQFNLFAKMIAESNQYMFTFPELKRSLSSYVSDCAIPAIAMGNFSGPGLDETRQPTTYFGAEALLKTNNMMVTLGSAVHKSVMTKYFPIHKNGVIDPAWRDSLNADYQADVSSLSAKTLTSLGAVLTCEDAYKAITSDMTANAAQLLSGGATEWARTGTNPLFESTFKAMLAQVGASGNASGYIMQQSMINSMNGSFREAAVQTGNNELMQSAALSQAEQSQKSAWSAGFTVFNNMMGYVFTVLQAFIFAITPMVIIALMVPGLGRSIFVNYIQILIWLTLWMPMLAVINYIITLFGSDSLTIIVGQGGGLSLNNQALRTEKTNDLLIAAQFLGTMVPLLTWGLVKGAMAFTEFISHGVGSSFATQAGGTAATGNLSMNNMSMDNTSMSKYNTAMASTVGFQSVQGFSNSGAAMVTQAGGGGNVTMNDSAVQATQQLQSTLSKAKAESESVSTALTQSVNDNLSISDTIKKVKGTSASSARTAALASLEQIQTQYSTSEGAGGSISAGKDSSVQDTGQKNDSLKQNAQGKIGASLSVKVAGNGVGLDASTGLAADIGVNNAKTFNKNDGAGTKDTADVRKNQIAKTGSIASSLSRQNASASGNTSGTGGEHGKGTTHQEAIQQMASKQKAFTEALTHMQSVTSSVSMSSGMDMVKLENVKEQMQALTASMHNGANIDAGFAKMEETVIGKADATAAAVKGATNEIVSATNAIPGPGVVSGGGATGASAQVAAMKVEVTENVRNDTAKIKQRVAGTERRVVTEQGNLANKSTSAAELLVSGSTTGPGGSIADKLKTIMPTSNPK